VPCKFFYLYAKCQHTDAECRFSHSVGREEALAHFERETAEKEEEERKRREKEEAEALGIVLPTTTTAGGSDEPSSAEAILPFGISFVRTDDPAHAAVEAAVVGAEDKDEEDDEGDDYEGTDSRDEEDDDDEDEDEEEVLLPFGLSASSFARPTHDSAASGVDELDGSFPAYAP
jgi:hypothetical protein